MPPLTSSSTVLAIDRASRHPAGRVRTKGPEAQRVLEERSGSTRSGQLLHHYPRRYIDRSRVETMRRAPPRGAGHRSSGRWSRRRRVARGATRRWSPSRSTTGPARSTSRSSTNRGRRPRTGRAPSSRSPGIAAALPRPAPAREPGGRGPARAMTRTSCTRAASPRSTRRPRASRRGRSASSCGGRSSSCRADRRPAAGRGRRRPSRCRRSTTALRRIHFPDDDVELAAARERLKFDELFVLELGVGFRRQRVAAERARRGARRRRRPHARARRDALPSSPTGRAARARWLRSATRWPRPTPMNLLLQGDVGSGKTLVALHACLIGDRLGHQAAIMAPTEVLAAQHARSVAALLEPDRRAARSLDGDRRAGRTAVRLFGGGRGPGRRAGASTLRAAHRRRHGQGPRRASSTASRTATSTS